MKDNIKRINSSDTDFDFKVNKDKYDENNDYENKDRQIFQKNCPSFKYYPPILPAAERIIAIGDLHGDLDLSIRILKLAKLIDNDFNWIGGNTIVVQIGDQLDSCRPNRIIGENCNDPDGSVDSEYSNSETAEDIEFKDEEGDRIILKKETKQNKKTKKQNDIEERDPSAEDPDWEGDTE